MLKILRNLFQHQNGTTEAAKYKKNMAAPPVDEFTSLVGQLNRYFQNHPDEKQLYSKELNFLNSPFDPLPGIEKIFYAILPYNFVRDFDYRLTTVLNDSSNGLQYAVLNNKKLYYHRGYVDSTDIQKSFTFLAAEQHPDSPHRYLDNNFTVSGEDIVADIGAAEGNFSLMIVEKAKKLIIVEADPVWVEALYKTFEPWQHKVVIINKALGITNDDSTVSLDVLGKEYGLTAAKMDIEGAEVEALNHCHEYLKHANLKMAITTYHRQTDATSIANILHSAGYSTTFSNGYMLFINDIQTPPFFRRGLIRTVSRSQPKAIELS